MKTFLTPYYSKLFCLDSTSSNTQLMMLADDNSRILDIYEDDKFIIRDVKDLSKKDYFRQLIHKAAPNQVSEEIRIYSIKEQDAKSSNYISLKTHKNFKMKKEKSCFDPYMIISHYDKVALSSMFFLNCNNWSSKPLDILIIGGGLGTLGFFFKSIFDCYVNITIADKHKELKELGENYFGIDFNRDLGYIHNTIQLNDKKSKTKWDIINNNYNSYINSLYDKKKNNKKPFSYDLIVIKDENYESGQNVSPHPDIISKTGLTQLKVSCCFIIIKLILLLEFIKQRWCINI